MELCISSEFSGNALTGDAAHDAECFAFIKATGFNEIDFGMRVPMFIGADWERRITNTLDAAKMAGVKVKYIHLPFDYPKSDEDDAGWEDFRLATVRGMELGTALNVPAAAIHPYTKMQKDYDEEAERSRTLRFLEFYCGEAKKRGLSLALENMRGAGVGADPAMRRYMTTTDELLYIADTCGIGVCWDTGHGKISGQNQFESLKRIGNRLKLVHLNDNYAGDDLHIPPFVGKVDWNGVAKGLKEIGYSGSLNFELSCKRVPAEVRSEYANYIHASAIHFRDILENC